MLITAEDHRWGLATSEGSGCVRPIMKRANICPPSPCRKITCTCLQDSVYSGRSTHTQAEREKEREIYHLEFVGESCFIEQQQVERGRLNAAQTVVYASTLISHFVTHNGDELDIRLPVKSVLVASGVVVTRRQKNQTGQKQQAMMHCSRISIG